AAKKSRLAMDVALGPGKSLGMTAFMMWMSGKQLNIWTINTLSGALTSPVRALRGTRQLFRPYEDPDGSLLQPKAAFVALNLVALGAGLYKMSTMGLLPTTAADFMGGLSFKEMEEVSGVAL
ncbi:hypothetical protein TeGR_g797, partial [Tetraparma gracilis]